MWSPPSARGLHGITCFLGRTGVPSRAENPPSEIAYASFVTVFFLSLSISCYIICNLFTSFHSWIVSFLSFLSCLGFILLVHLLRSFLSLLTFLSFPSFVFCVFPFFRFSYSICFVHFVSFCHLMWFFDLIRCFLSFYFCMSHLFFHWFFLSVFISSCCRCFVTYSLTDFSPFFLYCPSSLSFCRHCLINFLVGFLTFPWNLHQPPKPQK